MKRFSVFLAWVFPLSIVVGCGGGGVEVGSPSAAPKSAITPEFRAAMEKAGNKMQKRQRPKDFAAAGKEASKEASKSE